LPKKSRRSVVTFGVFDGVHRGHQALLGNVVDIARQRGIEAIALTFDPQPIRVHRPEAAPPLICSVADRVALIENQGIDDVIVVEYTADFARQGPEAFVRHVLIGQLGAEVIVLGADARFGRGNEGDLEMLHKLGARYGVDVTGIHGVGDSTDDARWSSSRVRAALGAGDVVEAARLLGRKHFVSGIVVRGDARGRTLGFPTANLGDPQGLIPTDGVYAGYLVRDVDSGPSRLPAAISVGTNPTFDGHERRVEAYVLDRTDLELYDEKVVVEFVARIRGTEKFDSVDALIAQMRRDVEGVREALANDRSCPGAPTRTRCQDVRHSAPGVSTPGPNSA